MLTPVPIFSGVAVLCTSVIALSSSFLYLRVRRVLQSLTKASEHRKGVSLFHCLPAKDKRSVAAILILWFGSAFTRHGSEYIFLITAVCLAGIFSLIAEGSTILPSKLDTYARKAEIRAAWLLGKEAGSSSPIKQAIANHRLTLELFYGDGHVEYEAPHVRSKVPALRLDSLLDKCPRNVTSRSER